MKKLLSLLLVSIFVLALVPAVSAQGGIGTADNPIEVYFVPSGEAQTIVEGGEVLAAALKEATGLEFRVSVPTSYAATVEAMCAAPDRSLGFIPAAGYVIANNRCGVEVAAAAVRFGCLTTGRSTWFAATAISIRLAIWLARAGGTAIPARPPATLCPRWN